MQRRVEGTYLSPEEVMHAVERLLQEGYQGEEILIITDDKSDYKSLEDLSLVEVDSVDPDEGKSLWEKTKETLSFGNYHSDEAEYPLTEYNVPEEVAEHYTTALENGEIVLLVNSDAPAHLDYDNLSTVNEEVLDEDEKEVKEEPQKADTTESFDAKTTNEDYFDPSQAQSAREDKVTPGKIDTEDEEEKPAYKPFEKNDDVKGDVPSYSSSAQKTESASHGKETHLPELTGDEDTVVKAETDHSYPENINTGATGGSEEKLTPKSPVRGQHTSEEPTTQTPSPESDAYYSSSFKEAGGKTIEDDEEKNK